MFLFEEPLKRPFSENESHAHITVDMTNVSAVGEISAAWLASFGVATWMDIVYKCLHCKKAGGIKSLIALLNHRKNESLEKIKIQCTDCDRQYSALNSYINHVTKIHHEHLSFWYVFVFCSGIV
jgi:DNA-directed RNA polymerase subunit RPC12/RpoP